MIVKEQNKVLFELFIQNNVIEKLSLNEREQSIIEMRWKYGYTFEIIGKQLNITSQRARILYQKTNEKLKSSIEVYFKYVPEFKSSISLKNEVVKQSDSQSSNNFINSFAELNTKTKLELARHRINTLEELADLSKTKLLLMPRFGKKTIEQLEMLLKQNDLNFKP